MKDNKKNTSLPGIVLAGLYRQSLVVPGLSGMDIKTGEEPSHELSGAIPKAQGPDEKEMASSVSSEARPAPKEQTGTDREILPGQKTSPATSAPAKQETIGSQPATAYKVLGNNSKKVVIIVSFPQETFLPEHHLQFLGRILGACKMNLGDIAIVNHATQSIVIHILKQQLQPAHILLFGPAPTDIQLPLSFPPFKQQQYDGCQYLYAPSLDELNQETEEGKQLKGKLWTCLKKMFNI